MGVPDRDPKVCVVCVCVCVIYSIILAGLNHGDILCSSIILKCARQVLFRKLQEVIYYEEVDIISN